MRFTDLLRTLIDARDWSLRDYAGRIGHKSPGHIALVLDGKRPLPLDELTTWLDAFEPRDDDERRRFRSMTEQERDTFWRLAIDDYAPADLKTIWKESRERGRRLARLEALVFGDGNPTPTGEDATLSADDLRQQLAALRAANRALRERIIALGGEA